MPVWKLNDGIRLGKILKPYGYLGFVRVAFFVSGLEEVLAKGSFIFIEWMEKPVPYFIEEILWDDDKTVRIKLADLNTEDDAKKLIGRLVVLDETEIPETILEDPDDVSMVGFRVIGTDKKEIGKVISLIERDPQSLLEVDHNGREILIPFHEDIIRKIDFRKRIITVDLPEGLVDL